MTIRNFPTIAEMSCGHNYILKFGQPYYYKTQPKGWHNGDRVVAASRVIAGESIRQVAHEVGCCVNSVRNWIATLDVNNPRLEG